MSNIPPKQDLRNFFNRAPFAVKIAKTVNFAVVILMRKAVSIPDILHNYYSSQLLVQPLFQHQRENSEVNLVENLQNAQKCMCLVQKANTCSETRIPMLFLYRSKYSHWESQHNSIKFLNRFHSFHITKKAIFHLFL